jgi:hypothetical protein
VGNIGSSSTGTAALDTGSWPAGSSITLIVNAGVGVAGCGGPAGYDPGCPAYGATRTSGGGAGGNAINLNYALSIQNNGIIGGGGTGGTSIHFGQACYNGCVYVPGPQGAGISGYWNGAGGGAPASVVRTAFSCVYTGYPGGALGSSGAAIKTNGNSYSVVGNSLFGSVIP